MREPTRGKRGGLMDRRRSSALWECTRGYGCTPAAGDVTEPLPGVVSHSFSDGGPLICLDVFLQHQFLTMSWLL